LIELMERRGIPTNDFFLDHGVLHYLRTGTVRIWEAYLAGVFLESTALTMDNGAA
jgi:hypothetical protein